MSEIELKFEVTNDDLRRLRRHPALAQTAERQRLSTTYFDTPDEALRKAGLTLRVRRRGEEFVQTVKRAIPDDLFDRDEWEAKVAGATPDLTLLADTPVGAVLAAQSSPLKPRFSVAIQRQARLLQVGGAEIEIVIDRGAIRAGLRREPILELELELKSGARGRLYDLAEALIEVAPIRLSFEAKSDRGYRLAAGAIAEPRKAEPLRLAPELSAEVAFGRIARACLVQLSGNAQVLRRGPQADALHQARIALRRLRSALVVFRPMLRDEAAEQLRGELKWLAGELDEARNLDVFLTTANDLAGASKEARRYLDHLREARGRAYQRAGAALDSARFARLLLKAAIWVEAGAWRGEADPELTAARAEPVGTLAARLLDHRRQRVRKAGRGLRRQGAEVRHELRLEAKKLRYVAEFFESAFPGERKRSRRFVTALKDLQEALGLLNDIAVAEQTAKLGVFGRRGQDLAFTAGQIVGLLQAREPRLIERAEKAFAAFKTAKPFWDAPAPPPVTSA